MWRQPLSVTGQARVREFLIVFEVDWRLEDAAGEVALERATIRLTRDYSFDEGEILAAQREEEFLRDDLGRAMAEQLIRRLEALSGAGS
ncbi:MAG: LPS assembly lipoprotein LptE, partial [Wenzhouxiangella sp.]|jgi:LPS-assembly lipoprotein|nr:LPS assembly lipoprotein LptE [Wenzhouxiangella sp.]